MRLTNPILRTKTLNEVIIEKGALALYEKTSVDQETQAKLNDYFLFERINSEDTDRFIWFYRRNLNLYYPVYRDQLDAWAALKARGWYSDNQGIVFKHHKGENTEKREYEEAFVGKVIAALTGNTTSNQDTDYNASFTTRGNADTTTEGEDSYTDTENGKDRAFAFRYPESNYQGGVIPYDLDNDPSVEFINSQADTVSRRKTEHAGNMRSDVDHSESASGSDQSGTKVVGDGTQKTDQDTDTKNDRNANTDVTAADHFDEVTITTGRAAIDLAKILIDLIPTTDFFNQLTEKMSCCFNPFYAEHEYGLDEWR